MIQYDYVSYARAHTHTHTHTRIYIYIYMLLYLSHIISCIIQIMQSLEVLNKTTERYPPPEVLYRCLLCFSCGCMWLYVVECG